MTALEDIDRTLDGLCACGCGARLDPAAESGWFASEVCQRRFQGGEGAAQEALAALYLDRLSMLALARCPAVSARPESDADLALTTSFVEPFVSSGVPFGERRDALAFRRSCSACGRRSVPCLVNVMRAPQMDVWSTGVGPEDFALPEIARAHGCSECLRPYPSPPLWAAVAYEASIGVYRFGLWEDPGAAEGPLVAVSADLMELSRFAAAAEAWRELEQALAERALSTCVVQDRWDWSGVAVAGVTWPPPAPDPVNRWYAYGAAVRRDLEAAERALRAPLRTGNLQSSFPYTTT